MRVNNSRILTKKNAKFSGHFVYVNLDVWEDFQIFISVPLSLNKKLKINSYKGNNFKDQETKIRVNQVQDQRAGI